MDTLTEVADILNGTLQDETVYRGKYTIVDGVATFDISGLNQTDFVAELIAGLNESEDGEAFIFTFTVDTQGNERISITKK